MNVKTSSYCAIISIFAIAFLCSCQIQNTFDSNKWKENNSGYRNKVLKSIENLNFLNNLNETNYLKILGEPKGSSQQDSMIMVSYEIRSDVKDGEENFFEYIQIYFDQQGNFLKYNRDQWSKEKKFERIKTIKIN